MTPSHEPDIHLSERAIACFVDRTLPPDERRTAEDHLAGCARCREEVAAVTALVGRRRMPRWYAIGPAAAAAAALLAMVLLPRDAGEPDGPRLRTGSAEGVAAIEATTPIEGDTVDMDGLVLVWRPLGVDARYRVHLTTADGSTVWEYSTGDTSAALPEQIGLLPGATYFWLADALLPDGRSATTGIRRFVVHP